MFQNQQMPNAEKISTKTGPPDSALFSSLPSTNASNSTEIESSIDLSADQLPWDSTIFDDNHLFKAFHNDFLNEHASNDLFLDSNSLDPIRDFLNSDLLLQQNETININTGNSYLTTPIASPSDQTMTLSTDFTVNNSVISKWSRFGNKKVLKYSEEYHQRRLNNNKAVKKARGKAKEKEKTRALKMSMLVNENEQLLVRVNQLTEELNSLKSFCKALKQRFETNSH